MNTDLLKPCPFCGGTDIRVGSKVFDDTYYQCFDCTTTGPNGADMESATIQWNTRWKPSVGEILPENPAKRMPCLMCDKPFRTNAEVRVCSSCKENNVVWNRRYEENSK